MPDSTEPRLGSIHLEDLAIVALTAKVGATTSRLYPELNEINRARLRARIKQLSRHDWPSSLSEDPLLRRGYTLRQCLRLMVALMLLDGHIPPSLAVPITRANEGPILDAIIPGMRELEASNVIARPTDPIMILLLGNLVEIVASDEWIMAAPHQLRFIARAQMAELWSSDPGFEYPGQRLVLDMSKMAAVVWHWLRMRDLMPTQALEMLVEDHAERLPCPILQGQLQVTKRR